MNYNKPEVVKLDSALGAIQGVDKQPPWMYRDNAPPHENDATPAAYEADE
jgi:hypothetical protein